MSTAKKFLAEVDETMVQMFGPDALAAWNALTAPANPLTEDDEVPGSEVLGGQVWPVSQGNEE